MLDYARPGDAVVVTAIDRLGRSVAEVTRTIAELGERRILLCALREGIDTATPTGRAVAAIMATLAELELELGRERRAACCATLKMSPDRRSGCNGGDGGTGGTGGTVAGARVAPLIERCWPAICKLAGKIYSDIVARHAAVAAALGLSADPATAAHQLALLRGGAALGVKVTRPSVPA